MKISKKKIAIFIPSLCVGGAERMMLNLAVEYKRRGEDVTLLVAEEQEGGFLMPDELKDSFICFDKPLFFRSIPPLMRYLREEKPDVLLTTLELCNFAGIIAKVMSWSKTRVVIRVTNTLSVSLKGSKPFRRLVRWWGAVGLYWLADEIVVNSEGSADDLSRTAWISRSRITVIDNPTITPEMIKMAEEPADHPWLKDKEAPVILSVGRFHQQKDFATLIKAFAKAKDKIPMKLIVLGEGDLRESLEELVRELEVEDSVSMPGFVSNPYAYMKRADLFVLSSLWEGQPSALIEAMACGMPVISTDCPSGPKEILDDGIYGELVPVGDDEAMAEAIVEVLKDLPNTTVSSEYAKERFSVESSADRYMEIF